MNDKTTAELKADLREQRQWLMSKPRDFRVTDYKRRIAEIEAELEARGETLEPPPKRGREAKRREVYQAQHTGR